MKALEDRIIIKKEKKTEEKTTSGFVLTKTNSDADNQGIVVEVGPGRILPNRIQIEPDVKVGDRVVFDPFAVQYFDYENEEYLVIFSKDILAVIEE
jgi:chaperonin GroES